MENCRRQGSSLGPQTGAQASYHWGARCLPNTAAIAALVRAAYTLHTLLCLSYTRYALTDTRRVYKHAIHNTNAHSTTRANTHSARKTQKQTGGSARDCQLRDSNPGLHRGRQMPWPLGHAPYAMCGDDRHIYLFGRRAEKHKGVLPKHNVKIFGRRRRRSPKPTTLDFTRTLEHTHTRLRVHTHTQHKLAIQTRLYTTNNSKQGINSITNLPMVPNTTKLKRNSTTTTELNRTSRSSTQTNTSALTKALKRSKKQERFKQQKPNNKELENTKRKP